MDWSYLLWRFDGRIARQTFWIALLSVAAVEFLVDFAARAAGGDRLSPIISLAFGYPETAILAKRGHDRNIPTWVPITFFGYSALIDFLFVINAAGRPEDPSALIALLTVPWIAFMLALLIDFGCRKGTSGPNRYGPDPLGPRSISRHNGSGRDS